MNEPIPDPVRGKDVLAWALPVTRALNALRDKPGATVRNERDRRPAGFLHPFEVRWSGEENDGEGAWGIWIPDIAAAVMYGGHYVTPTGVTASEVMASGWYTIDDLEDDGDVYLNITVPDTGSATATISSEAGQSSTGSTVIAVKIATLTAETDDDDVTMHKVTQLVDSALTIGGSGGGGISGYTGSLVRITRLEWETYELHLYGVRDTYENGLLKTPGTDETVISTVTTVAHSTLH